MVKRKMPAVKKLKGSSYLVHPWFVVIKQIVGKCRKNILMRRIAHTHGRALVIMSPLFKIRRKIC